MSSTDPNAGRSPSISAPTTRGKIILKIIVLGSSNVGKTSLMKRYTTGKFSEIRRVTIGTDYMTRKLVINDIDVLIQIWDTAGQEKFHQGTIGNAFYRGANGCLLVYDVNNDKSYEQIMQWRDELFSRIGKDTYFPIVVVGNKVDLRTEENRLENQSEVMKWCQDNSYGHIEASAKDDIGVEAAMQAIAALALDEYRSNPEGINGTNSKGDVVKLGEIYTTKKSSCGCS
jgi:Ras-related protein Rab-7A